MPTSNLAFVWVKVPRLAGGTATEKIYLYYGNTKAPAGADAAGTYDASQVLVYHFGTEPTATDSTAFANNAGTFTAEANPASLIGAGAKFSGTTSIGTAVHGVAATAAGSRRDGVGLGSYRSAADRCLCRRARRKQPHAWRSASTARRCSRSRPRTVRSRRVRNRRVCWCRDSGITWR